MMVVVMVWLQFSISSRFIHTKQLQRMKGFQGAFSNFGVGETQWKERKKWGASVFGGHCGWGTWIDLWVPNARRERCRYYTRTLPTRMRLTIMLQGSSVKPPQRQHLQELAIKGEESEAIKEVVTEWIHPVLSGVAYKIIFSKYNV